MENTLLSLQNWKKKTLEQNQWTCCGRLFLYGVLTKPYIVLKRVLDRECAFIKKKMSNVIELQIPFLLHKTQGYSQGK